MASIQAAHRPAIAIAATFTIEPILAGLRCVLEHAGLAFDVCFSPYNQVFQELLAETSVLKTNTGGVGVVLIRVEDFIREITDVIEARTAIERTVDQLSDALTQYARRVKIPTVLAVLPPSPGATKDLRNELETATVDLATRARTLPGITMLSPAEIDLLSAGSSYDALSDNLAHIPYTEEFYASLALAIARKIHALHVPSHKVLVLDCDNTLWRGVVGEDGVDGITIPPALACVQRFATELQAQGVLLCLVSKNSESDVMEVFEKRSDMILSKDHIVAHRINWEPKPQNMVSLARSLNLGLDSFVYLDDNPVECELMRTQLPDVVTLQVPPDEEVKSFLSHLWTFDKIAVTEEDAQRTKMYRENAARKEQEKSTTDIAEFIASLKVVIDIDPPDEQEWPRVAQLTQRTNQFNFTTLRRTEGEMRAISADGFTVLRVKVRDRFGDYGLVGVAIVSSQAQALVVDTLLLSCRVLGRGVEHAIVRHLGEIAIARGLNQVVVHYFRTPKNEPARAFIESVAAQFREQERDRIAYSIPGDVARGISHRPGHDPAAVIEALKSEENRPLSSNSNDNLVGLIEGQSRRYENLARTLVSGRDVLRVERFGKLRARNLPGEPQNSTTKIETGLLSLWEELLGFAKLGIDDDYFALGGTSLVAARLFAEIERRFAVRLPLTTILEAPTVRTLARRLDAPQFESFAGLVELKASGAHNLFLVHDGDGETLLYLNLARRMPNDLAVFGIEPRRLPGIPLAHGCIEEMAAFYVEQIRRKQPQGPYRLGGMCAGGVVAYEMASQLASAGEIVEIVLVLDAATPQAPKRAGRITKQRLGRVTQMLVDARDLDRSGVGRSLIVIREVSRKFINAACWEIKQRWTRRSVQIRFRLLCELLSRKRSWPRFIPELSVRQIYDTAEARYVPKPLYEAPVALIRAREGEGGDTPYINIYADETLGWGKVANNLAVVDVNGGHSSMLQEPFVNCLAKELMRYLDKTAKREQFAVENDNHRPDLAIEEFVPQS